MSALSKSGRMLRWGMLPIAAAVVLALGASPADADHKRNKHWNNNWGGHSQNWDGWGGGKGRWKHDGWGGGKRHWNHGGWGHNWRPYYPRQRYYNYYNYYAPPPTYYYPPPAYYYPRPRYYNPYGGSFSFGLTVPFDD